MSDSASDSKPEEVLGTREHTSAMRDWENRMRVMPQIERNRRVEIGQTAPDILIEPKGDVDADVGYQGPQDIVLEQ